MVAAIIAIIIEIIKVISIMRSRDIIKCDLF